MSLQFIWNDQENLECLKKRNRKWEVFIAFYILENNLNDLPLEILHRIFKLVLASSTYEWP